MLKITTVTVLAICLLGGCATKPKYIWKNPNLTTQPEINSQFSLARAMCIDKANVEFGYSAPRDKDCSKAGVANSFQCGYENSSNKKSWNAARNNNISLCMLSLGWSKVLAPQ